MRSAPDAMLGDMGFDAMDAYARKATLDQRNLQAAAKDAGSKNPAKRAKAYEKLQTLRRSWPTPSRRSPTPQAAVAEERNAQEAVRAAIEETASSYRLVRVDRHDQRRRCDRRAGETDHRAGRRRRAVKRFDLAGNDRDRAQAARTGRG